MKIGQKKLTTRIWLGSAFVIAFLGFALYRLINGSFLPAGDTGPAGDLIAGTIGVAISCSSAILLYVTFRRQDITNRMVEQNFNEIRVEKVIERLQSRLNSDILRNNTSIKFQGAIKEDYLELDKKIRDLTDDAGQFVISNAFQDKIYEIREAVHADAVTEFGLLVKKCFKAVGYLKHYDEGIHEAEVESTLNLLTKDEKLLVGILYNWCNEEIYNNNIYIGLPQIKSLYNEHYSENLNYKTIPRLKIEVYLPEASRSPKLELLQDLTFTFNVLSKSPMFICSFSIVNILDSSSLMSLNVKDTEFFLESESIRAVRIDQLLEVNDVGKLFTQFFSDTKARSLNEYGVVFKFKANELAFYFNLNIIVEFEGITIHSFKWSIHLNN